MKKLFLVFSFAFMFFLFFLCLVTVFFSSCHHKEEKHPDGPQGSVPANYVGAWIVEKQTASDKPIIMWLNAEGFGVLSSTEIPFQWKVDKDSTIWRKLGSEWNGTWKTSKINASGLTFQENAHTMRLKKIISPNPSEYTGTWKVNNVYQSADKQWDRAEDISGQYSGKTIIFKSEGDVTTMMGIARKWIVDPENRLIWLYGTDHRSWEAIYILDFPKDGKMSLVISQSPGFLNIDLEKQ